VSTSPESETGFAQEPKKWIPEVFELSKLHLQRIVRISMRLIVKAKTR
jgi:hypothetical protein